MTAALSMAEVRDLPPVVDVATAARVLGISRSAAYELVRTNTFPAQVLSVGRQYRVLTSTLLERLGIAEKAAEAQREREAQLREEVERMVADYRATLLRQFGLGNGTAGS